MKAYDFECVTFDADIYCVECLPDGVSIEDDDVHPVFASEEWDEYPVCCECGREHDYVHLTPGPADSGIDWPAVRAEIDSLAWEPDRENPQIESRSVYLGTVMSLAPSGKYHTCWAISHCSATDLERDFQWFETAESEADEYGLSIESGDGDPCDLFAVEIRDTPADSTPEDD